MWQRVTDLAKRKQAMTVSLSLSGRYRDVATSISIDSLDADSGMDELLKILDENFKKESLDTTYETYVGFEALQRKDLSMADFIVEFEAVSNRLKSCGITLPEELLGCKLLNSASLDTGQKQLVLSTVTSLKYDEVKRALRRIFGASTNEISTSLVKTEAFFARGGGQWKKTNQKAQPEKRTGPSVTVCRMWVSLSLGT